MSEEQPTYNAKPLETQQASGSRPEHHFNTNKMQAERINTIKNSEKSLLDCIDIYARIEGTVPCYETMSHLNWHGQQARKSIEEGTVRLIKAFIEDCKWQRDRGVPEAMPDEHIERVPNEQLFTEDGEVANPVSGKPAYEHAGSLDAGKGSVPTATVYTGGNG